MMVSHVADDDFILFTQVPPSPELAERRLQAICRSSSRTSCASRSRTQHGEDIAALCGIYVGAATVFRNPKIRTERLIYRGIREAAQAARGAEQWERTRKVADLKATIREGAVFIEYHPIIVTRPKRSTATRRWRAASRRELRSPEVLFEVAERSEHALGAEPAAAAARGRRHHERAEGRTVPLPEHRPARLRRSDVPQSRSGRARHRRSRARSCSRSPSAPRSRTTRASRNTCAAFRERGFKFAVDDAGSGYAGLGSIANLAPDYIKLDISLIANIDYELPEAEPGRDDGELRERTGRDGHRGRCRAAGRVRDGEASWASISRRASSSIVRAIRDSRNARARASPSRAALSSFDASFSQRFGVGRDALYRSRRRYDRGPRRTQPRSRK